VDVPLIEFGNFPFKRKLFQQNIMVGIRFPVWLLQKSANSKIADENPDDNRIQ
jgi:hypothetical protein